MTLPSVLIADDHDNEVVFPTLENGVEGVQSWFNDVLEASCQGLSDEGIEESFPGLLTRLREAIVSAPAPGRVLSVEQLSGYANAVAQRVLGACVDDAEREALGVPTRFHLRAASNLEVPDIEALVQLRNK